MVGFFTKPLSTEYVTTEMHTGGEPFRIIEKGYPDIKGATILEKIRCLKKELDLITITNIIYGSQ
jgi:trans-L-3-hydroxyproline dehydratase